MATYNPAGMHPTQNPPQVYYSTTTDSNDDVLSLNYFDGIQTQEIHGEFVQVGGPLAYKAADRVTRYATFTDLTPGNVTVTPA